MAKSSLRFISKMSMPGKEFSFGFDNDEDGWAPDCEDDVN
jgi:hypothetical protein